MASPRSHHYVPQFYLRQFGNDGGAIALYNVRRRMHVPCASIAGQCQRDFFYGEDDNVERALSKLEGEAARVIRTILQTRTWPPICSEGDLVLMSFFAIQRARTAAAANEANAILTKHAREIARNFAPPPPRGAEHVLDQIEANHANAALFTLSTMGGLGPLLLDLQRLVVLNNTAVEFIASDAPVVLHNTWCEGTIGRGSAGLSCAGLQALFPIAPRVLLFLFDPEVYAVGCRQNPSSVILSDVSDVQALNGMQLANVDQNLYYSGDRTTAEHIDRLPFSWVQSAEEAMVVRTGPVLGAKSQILQTYRASRATMKISFQRVLRRARRIPLTQRSQMMRRISFEVAQELQKDALSGIAGTPTP